MTHPQPSPDPGSRVYNVTYSERVLEELLDLVRRNPKRAHEIRTAFREMQRRLRIYPQFGQALSRLSLEPAELWIGTVPPLVVQYVLVDFDEERATATGFHGEVMVVRPFRPFLHTGIV